MNDVYFYDFEFNLLCIEKNCISSMWSIKYDDVGTFEAVFPIESDAVKAVLENDYVIAVQGENQAIVTGKIISKKGTIYGRTPNWILTKRIVPKKVINTEITDAVSDILGEAFSDVENFCVEKGDALGKGDLETSGYLTALEMVNKCLKPFDAGHLVYLDIPNKKWIFKLLTKNDTDIIMSEDIKNVYNVEYTDDMQNLFTDCVYEDSSNVSHDIASDKKGIYRWVCFSDKEKEADAKDELSKKKRNHQSRAMTRNFDYPQVFKLGDKVRIRKSASGFERLCEVYIYGVNIWYDASVYGAEPVFKEL